MKETSTVMVAAKPKKGPVREYRSVIVDSEDPGYINKLLVGTPSTGNVRMEWVMARYGQIIPVNWSMVQMIQWISGYVPIHYSVADAQNLIVKELIEKDFEWLLLIEQDDVLPPNAFIQFDKYMREEKVPIVSGLYFTKSIPSEPLVFRGRGVGYYKDWKLGDLVWCDGVPTGCLLIHGGLLRAMWEESPEYLVGGIKTRRVFETPRKMWYDPESQQYNMTTGTSDLDWCTKIMKGGFFKKSGWDEYQDKQYPFLIDTNIFCKHIDENGVQYPQV